MGPLSRPNHRQLSYHLALRLSGRRVEPVYLAQESGNGLVFLVFKALPYGSGTGPRSSAVGFRSRPALLLLVSVPIIGWSGVSFADRPFDSTDAAVADVGQLEVELGPVQFRRSEEERTL